ncbi:alpha/beta fold hydrolase [Pandoraea anhela]|uniref:Alpha/beta hydrolase n=1 Tax=Pandoraea anhela TaxID=2508295 RepID=A0A5E4ZB53_9BURK|nr:alpha/beta hydrolase [Pandoraea anhela]VVE57655.1 alpha/beta hydrolase [Pandoraea anhela]
MTLNILKQLSLAVAGALAFAASAQAAPDADLVGKNVVLVHGAFADGSSWAKVIPLLQQKGLHVTSVQNPLTSLTDDVAAATRAIHRQKGPVILVGHSWAGSVITQAGNDDQVKALVYVAAFAPDSGQSSNEMKKDVPAPAWAAEIHKDSAGYLTLSDKAIAEEFAQDVTPDEARWLAATQGPWYSGCVTEKIEHAAWHEKPSWYVLTTKDHVVPPELQARLAKQMGAKVFSLETSHVPMVSQPDEVAAAIIAAARQVR